MKKLWWVLWFRYFQCNNRTGLPEVRTWAYLYLVPRRAPWSELYWMVLTPNRFCHILKYNHYRFHETYYSPRLWFSFQILCHTDFSHFLQVDVHYIIPINHPDCKIVLILFQLCSFVQHNVKCCHNYLFLNFWKCRKAIFHATSVYHPAIDLISFKHGSGSQLNVRDWIFCWPFCRHNFQTYVCNLLTPEHLKTFFLHVFWFLFFYTHIHWVIKV